MEFLHYFWFLSIALSGLLGSAYYIPAISYCHPLKPPSCRGQHHSSQFCDKASVMTTDGPLSLSRRTKHVKIVDTFIFDGEFDMLDIRLMTMWHWVDYFVLVESNLTFTGKIKPLYFKENEHRYQSFMKKIHYYRYTIPLELTTTWEREAAMRNSLLDVNKGLYGMALRHGDVILLSDVDEIIKPEILKSLKYCQGFPALLCFATKFYYYSFEYEISTQWTHPQAATYFGNETIVIDKGNMNTPLPLAESLRMNRRSNCIVNSGWHCSYCFPTIEQFVNKLKSFSHIEYDTDEFTNHDKIMYRIMNGLDLFNRSDMLIQKHLPQDIDAPLYVLNQRHCYNYLTERTKWKNSLEIKDK